MEYLPDLIVLAGLIVCVVIGVKRGVVKSAVHLAGSFFAGLLASALGGVAARWVFDALFRRALVERVETTINAAGVSSVAEGLRQLFRSLPDFLVRALEDAGVTTALLEGTLAHSTGRAAELVTDALAPVFIGFLRVLAGVVLFMLLQILVRVLADLAGKAFELPVLRQMNGVLGGVAGFLLALVFLWLVDAALRVFIPMLSPDSQADLDIALSGSILAGPLVRINPLAGLFR